MPEPYTNLQLAVGRGQNEYLQWRDDGAPEEILEALRQYIVVAADRLATLNEPANANMPAGPMPGATAPPMASDMPTGAPQAAFAQQAMDLVAS
jgi:hypothetical protein